MKLTTEQADRAAGVLLGQACGDALGVPYEFATPPGPAEPAQMRGGGLGGFAPGEWSDDTAMAVAVAEVLAGGADVAVDAAADDVANGFLRWYADGPADIGVQTSRVLGWTGRHDADGRSVSRVMREQAMVYARSNPRSAGNGALMRTSPVALRHLDDRERAADAARLVAALTHADPLAGDSCVLWTEAIRVAVTAGEIDPRAGLDLVPGSRRGRWAEWLDDATDVERNRSERVPGARFVPNGFTVTALQAAVAAVVTTPVPADLPCRHLQDALHAAVRIGDDTDTVAAIAGGLLGARWGASAVPWRWRRAVHGWPGAGAARLVELATLATRGGRPDRRGWPGAKEVAYAEAADAVAVPHPYDDGLLLGTHASRGHEVDAVVSLCRVGQGQPCFEGATEVVESRLVDSDHPSKNPNLLFALHDAADAVRGLRAEGKRVLLHCVAAHQRTPSVAVAYAVLLGHDPDEARAAVRAVLPGARANGALWDAAADVALAERGA
ncbi:hydrolase [Nocardioides sp. zg-579]|uniref:Hydrolase n=1 Tax=Nocardioides marmotae TaxID=2663857 RepID=A0A6I3J942_9ACTN|nr:ADP-ribosylglycohydrolase family protein [Nocardioides marmotae]MCR6030356.1 hydrolase [Gordonia jinghuaiqii]MTB93990.1 hydrolase [Nocardioides marmotae]QKE00305.1 hydrolase [Nocardioides marmotae]